MHFVRSRTDNETFALLVDVLDSIRLSTEQFRNGREFMWLDISARLNLLLTDESNPMRGKKGVPLALRIFPGIEFHPLINEALPDPEGRSIYPTVHGFGPGGVQPRPLFNMTSLMMPLAQWLDQGMWVNNGEVVKLGEFLRVSRDNLGGVHFDNHVNVSTHRIEDSLVVGVSGRPHYIYDLLIVGEYVWGQIYGYMLGAAGDEFVNNADARNAHSAYNQTLAHFIELGDIQGQARTYLSMGFFAIAANQFKAAKERYELALPLVRQLNWQEGTRAAERNLAKLNDILANPE